MRAECETLIGKRRFSVTFQAARFGWRQWLAVQLVALAVMLAGAISVAPEE